jgi:hypothetical protein
MDVLEVTKQVTASETPPTAATITLHHQCGARSAVPATLSTTARSALPPLIAQVRNPQAPHLLAIDCLLCG